MKILLLSDANSVHTIKWAKSLSLQNVEIEIFSLGEYSENIYENYPNISVFSLQVNTKLFNKSDGSFVKLIYLKVLSELKQTIKQFKPDILHAHYASSYGLLGALSKFHPYIISVWGSDVFDFPNKSFIHRKIIKYNLNKADKILSTSMVMAEETKKYTKKQIEVTPFGIDINKFMKFDVNSLFSKGDIVIGTVKTLHKKYGIEYLIRAFKIISDKYPELPLKLLLVGGGTDEKELKELVEKLELPGKTIFTGKVPFQDVPKYHNMLSVSVFVSNSESFGVAVIEASACEKPVVVSDVGGLPEVVEKNITGIIVPKQNPEATAKAIEKLILDEEYSNKLGKAGRERVKKMYNWEQNVAQMINIYKQTVQD